MASLASCCRRFCFPQLQRLPVLSSSLNHQSIRSVRLRPIWKPKHDHKKEMRLLLDRDKIVKNLLGREQSSAANWPEPNDDSRRCGVIAIKLGMVPAWTKRGERKALTVLQIPDNQVVSVNTIGVCSRTSLEIGAVNETGLHRVTKPMIGHFRKWGVPPKKKTRQFHCTLDAMLAPGTVLGSNHFVPGQYVDLLGYTTGKGGQGVMKKWGYKGQPKTHGQSKTHRRPGNIANKKAGLWKGTKMAGRMGGKLRCARSLQVARINREFNLIFVAGSVPGTDFNYVFIKDASYKKQPKGLKIPFPTSFYADQDGSLPPDAYAENYALPNDPTVVFEASS